MAAIALAESSGNPNATNASTGAAGLWQINPVHAGEPGIDFANIDDPTTNAQAAVAVYKSQGLCAWQTFSGQGCSNPSQYTNGYAQYLPLAGGTVQQPSSTSNPNIVAGSAPSSASAGTGFTPAPLPKQMVLVLALAAFVVIAAVALRGSGKPVTEVQGA
jgi:soluble lytic murein transglycosylase-like protein